MKKIMLIGFGAMAQEVLARLPQGVEPGWIVARESHHAAIRDRFGTRVAALTSPEACDGQPQLVLECASQQAVGEYAECVLRRGWRLAVISTGALADELLHQRLLAACHRGGGRLIPLSGAVAGLAACHRGGGRLIPLSGAVAGLDGLAAAREGGLDHVIYQSCKSPASWRGSHAETQIDLMAVSDRQVFWRGSAREAARLFPANANVAATIALAGIGMDQTQVELMVDPATKRNTHTLQAAGKFGDLYLELRGYPLSTNAKTSMLAALSAVEACRQLLYL